MRTRHVTLGLAVIAVATVAVQYVAWSRTQVTEAFMKSTFTHDATLGAYVEALPRINGGPIKAAQGVLLLHGYSSSPHEFDSLVGPLEDAGIPYYAPLLTGFGLDDFRLLEAAKPGDWVRDAVLGYDIVAGMAEAVSIVGHSNGGALAAIVAEYREVEKLILTGPNIFVHPNDVFIKSIATTPVVADVAAALIPVFVKPQRPNRITNTDTKDPEAAKRSLHFPALASRSLVTLWMVQDRVDLTRASFDGLWLLYGADDQSVDIPSTVAALTKMGIPFQQRAFEESGHNILEDYEKDAVARTIVDILTK